MRDFKMSPHFSYYEMTRTDIRRYLEANRDVPAELMPNGYALCAALLEPIRCYFDRPLIVHSGYRSPALNTGIGGSKSSQHMQFEAADFHVSGVDIEETFQWIWKESSLRWGQLIREGWAYGEPTWIHISLGEPWWKRTGDVLTFEAGKYTRLQ